MLAKHWKRIGLIILIIACFANITAKLVKSVSFDENVKSTVRNVVQTVDGKIKDVVGGNQKEQTNTVNNETQNTQTQNAVQNNFIIQPMTNSY